MTFLWKYEKGMLCTNIINMQNTRSAGGDESKFHADPEYKVNLEYPESRGKTCIQQRLHMVPPEKVRARQAEGLSCGY